MNTQTRSKLTLRRETLQTLSGTQLGGIHGGAETHVCTITAETRQCAVARLHDKANDTVYRPGGDPPAQNDTVYRGNRGKVYAI